MNSIEPIYGDRIRYKLYSLGLEKTLHISDPIGYDEDEKELKRDNKYFGIIRKSSDNLKFYQGLNDGRRNTDGGYDFIIKVDNLGINEVLYLIKERKDGKTNIYKEIYRTELDLSTLEKEVDKQGNKFCTLKGFEGGLDSLIKSRKSDEIEIDRTTSLKGDSISEIESSTFQLKGRKIYKLSKQEEIPTLNNSFQPDLLNFRKTQLISSSDDSFQNVLNKNAPELADGSVGDMFYAISKEDKIIDLTIEVDVDIAIGNGNDLYIGYIIYTNGDSYTNSGTYNILSRVTADTGVKFNVNKSVRLKLNKDESLSAPFLTRGGSIIYIANKFNITLEELSEFPPTQCKAYLMKNVYSKFIEVISGRLAFKSDFFDNGGIGEYMAITDGGLVRNLPNWKLKTSLKDVIDSFSATWNLSVGVERDGRNEYFRTEKINYFFDPKIILSLTNKVQNIKRKKAKEFIYSGAEFGYKGEGSYENIQGLDKTNGIVKRNTIIERVENIYKKISPFGTDDYEREIPRRLQYSTNPTEDTKYDDKIMILDGKPTLTDVIEQRASSFVVESKRSDNDDFKEIPTGVVDAEGLTNGRWTPLAMALRHGQWMKAGLLSYLNSDISFSSSNGNTGLTGVFKETPNTPYLKGIEYSEKSNILVSDLQGNFFYPEWITFNHVVTEEMLDTLQGSYEDNGSSKRNFYGLIEFINEDGKKDKGYLFSVKPNGNGTWKLLSYRKLKTDG